MNLFKCSLVLDAFGVGTAVSGAAQAGADILTTQLTNESNERNVDETNKANISMNDATNQANRDIADATNATNMAINQANIDYQNAYNQQVFERADTAFQRSAKDASAVGINPLALSGSVAGGDVAGSSSAPQASLGAQTGAPMQSPTLKAFQAVAPQIAGISSLFSELTKVQTGMAQRDLLEQEAQKMKNENEFFTLNGYYPSNMSDFEKIVTAFTNAYNGKDNFFSRGAQSANEFSKDTFGIDWTQSSGSSSPKGKIKSLTIDPAVNAYNQITDSVKNVINSDNKTKTLGIEVKKLGSSFVDYLKYTNPITGGIYHSFGGK